MNTDIIHNSYLFVENSIKKAKMKYYIKNSESIKKWNKIYSSTDEYHERKIEYNKTYYKRNQKILKQKKREKYARQKELCDI